MKMDESKDYIKNLELRNKNGVIHLNLIRLFAKVCVPENKSPFRLHDDPGSDNWNDYIMNGEKVAIYDDNLVFKNNGKIFTLRGDVLKTITEYKVNKTDSPDAKLIIDTMDELHLDIHSRGRSLRYRNFIEKYFNKRAIFASGLKTIFFPVNPNQICDRQKLLLQEKRTGNTSKKIIEQMMAIFDELLDYKCITPSEQKESLKILILYKMCYYIR